MENDRIIHGSSRALVMNQGTKHSNYFALIQSRTLNMNLAFGYSISPEDFYEYKTHIDSGRYFQFKQNGQAFNILDGVVYDSVYGRTDHYYYYEIVPRNTWINFDFHDEAIMHGGPYFSQSWGSQNTTGGDNIFDPRDLLTSYQFDTYIHNRIGSPVFDFPSEYRKYKLTYL
jgi:hypothetical protein